MNLPTPTSDPAQVVLTFLESIGQRADAEYYLGLFRKLPKESFALLVVDTQVAATTLGSVIEQLRFLVDLGLSTPVVLGLFRPAKGLADAKRLQARLPQAGLQASVHASDLPDLGARVREELQRERVPLIHFDAANTEVSDRMRQLAQLALQLETRKVVVLRPQGGLRPRASVTLAGDELTRGGGGSGISVVNLRTDLSTLSQPGILLARDAELLSQASQLLTQVTRSDFAISITSPLNMLRELFTVRGAGTLIKAGAQIERIASYTGLDQPRLTELLESTFGKRLLPGFWDRPVLDVYLETEYRGAAILQPSPLGSFLTKFAVSRPAQGEGIGRDLWAAMLRDHPKLYWRAKRDNPISSWYVGHCDGMAKTSGWTVYWRGIEQSNIPQAIAQSCALPEDFAPAAP